MKEEIDVFSHPHQILSRCSIPRNDHRAVVSVESVSEGRCHGGMFDEGGANRHQLIFVHCEWLHIRVGIVIRVKIYALRYFNITCLKPVQGGGAQRVKRAIINIDRIGSHKMFEEEFGTSRWGLREDGITGRRGA